MKEEKCCCGLFTIPVISIIDFLGSLHDFRFPGGGKDHSIADCPRRNRSRRDTEHPQSFRLGYDLYGHYLSVQSPSKIAIQKVAMVVAVLCSILAIIGIIKDAPKLMKPIIIFYVSRCQFPPGFSLHRRNIKLRLSCKCCFSSKSFIRSPLQYSPVSLSQKPSSWFFSKIKQKQNNICYQRLTRRIRVALTFCRRQSQE